jgi:hypothetical protein
VVVGVAEPGRQRHAEVGHTVDGAQLGKLLELDAPRGVATTATAKQASATALRTRWPPHHRAHNASTADRGGDSEATSRR